MIRREGKRPSSKDLSVCFPTRAHLALMPKPAYSPHRHLQRHHQNHLRKSMRQSRGGSMSGHASAYIWSGGTKQMSSDNLSEPTSPKVTCAGQIKIRPSTKSCKNWQTVMEEIERLHDDRKKKPTWMEALGFKKEVMPFLSCLRNIKFHFRCLGAFSHVDITSDEEDDEGDSNNKGINQDHDHHDHDHDANEEVSSQTMFSKWFMVLQENQDCGVFQKDENSFKSNETDDHHHSSLPPTNALMLMRCRSAPAKSWMEEKEEEEQQQQEGKYGDDNDLQDHDQEEEEEHADKDQKLGQKKSKRKSLSELMKNESDFYKLSVDIAKETWIIGGIQKDPFSRSRSWRR